MHALYGMLTGRTVWTRHRDKPKPTQPHARFRAAPPRSTLRAFGGTQTIREFREDLESPTQFVRPLPNMVAVPVRTAPLAQPAHVTGATLAAQTVARTVARTAARATADEEAGAEDEEDVLTLWRAKPLATHDLMRKTMGL